MKIYTRIVLDCSTWNIIAEDSFEYDGPMALCTGAEEAAAASGAAKAAAPAAEGVGAGLGAAGGTGLGAGAASAALPGVFPAAAGLGAAGAGATESALAGLGAGAAGAAAGEAIPRVEITGQAPVSGAEPTVPVVPAGGIPGTQPMAATTPASAPAAPGVNALNPEAGGMQTTPTASGLPPGGGVPEGALPAEQAAAPVESRDLSKIPQAKGGVEKALESLGIWKNGELGRNALPLGLNLGSAALQRNSASSLQKQLQKTAAPASSAAQRLLDQSASGQIPPAIMQQFDKSLKDKVGEIQQRYANMGRDAATDSAAQAEIQKATDARDAQVAQYSSQLTTQGLQAAQVASGPSTQAALAGAQQDQALSQAMAQSLQQMALLEALSRRTSGV